jgi:signal transduction histidine kinase
VSTAHHDAPRQPRAGRPAGALLLAAAYLTFGVLWIVFSDHLGAALFASSSALTTFQSWKGAAFVGFSALFVYLALAGAAAGQGSGAGAGASDAPAAPAGRSLPVVVLLWLLVLATGLPMVGLLAWHVARETRTQTEVADRLVRDIARKTADDTASHFDAQLRVAASLAQRSAVRALDPAACDPALGHLAMLHEGLLEVGSFDLDGRLVCGRPARRALAPRGWSAELRARRAPLVSPLERDEATGAWAYAVVHPVLGRDDRLAGAVEVLLPAAALAGIVEGPVGEGGAITLLDQTNTIASRSPQRLETIGRRMRDGANVRLFRSALPGTFRAAGVDGVQRLYAVQPVGRTGWLAAAGVPVDVVYAPVRTALLRSLLVGLGMVGLCLWLVLRLRRSITAPLRALQRTADAAAAGDFSGRAPESGPAELAAVAAGFNRMLERLPRLQQELRESEARSRRELDNLSRHVPGAIYTVLQPKGARRGTVFFISDGSREIFELEPADLRRQDNGLMIDRIHPLDRTRWEHAVGQAAADLRPVTIEYRALLPRQGLRHHLMQVHPERQPDGSLVWYGCTVDVTLLKSTEQALQLMNETLEHRIAERTAALAAANDALESFSYSVAHDLRAPLASIEGFAQATAESLRKGDTARATGYIDRVVANAARMDTLIDGFLALARAGRVALVDSQVDLQRLVAEILAEAPQAARTRVNVGTLPRVLGDQATLRQVWDNLLSNALKYSSRREHPLVTVGWEATGAGELLFWVKDNGAGFDPEYADKLFVPFARLHKAEEFDGTGVGLALVRRIVERHGGRIWASSQPDEGAAFYFTLPRERLLQGPSGEA